MAEVQLLWLHIPTCTSAAENRKGPIECYKQSTSIHKHNEKGEMLDKTATTFFTYKEDKNFMWKASEDLFQSHIIFQQHEAVKHQIWSES